RIPMTHAFKAVDATAFTDGRGELTLQVRPATGAPESPFPLRVSAVQLGWRRGAAPAGRSLGLYALIAVCLGAWAFPMKTAWGYWGALLFPTVGIAILLHSAGLYVRMYLPALAVAAVGSSVILLVALRLGLSAPSTRWIAGLAAARIALALLPAFPSIDAVFHAHNVDRYQAGMVITSEVSDAVGGSHAIPYGVTLYALLAPFLPPGDYARAEMAIRATMALLESTAPLVVFLIMRTAGASASAASGAGQIAAALPESLLVVAKGIAANIFGQWLSLWAVWALLRRGSILVPTVLIGLVVATHPGAAVTLGALVALWALLLAGPARTRKEAARLLACLAAGGLLGVLLYYRNALGLVWEFWSHVHEFARGEPFVAFRWVHLGKLAQNLVLKLGGLPVVLAAAYWRDARAEGALRTLVAAWLRAFALFAVLALFTPLAFRFEYFFAPAVAMAAAARYADSPWLRRATIVAASIQLALGLAALYGRFDLINVIIPSMRWPLAGITRTLSL
ncbi:MAG TPA: hypothetical protein VGQ33_17785, partial [Vicinamibacteria bacterium]|nr:hypothetical protein [Vicinamibacteria bacterium]